MLVNTAQAFMSPATCYALLWSVRHLKAPHRTTVRLENYFWEQIDRVAEKKGLSWRHWAENTLSEKTIGRKFSILAKGQLLVQCFGGFTGGTYSTSKTKSVVNYKGKKWQQLHPTPMHSTWMNGI